MKPELIPDEIVEAGMDGFDDVYDMDGEWELLVRSTIAAVWPLIAKAEREQCAAVARSAAEAARVMERGDVNMAIAIEEAIRAQGDDNG